MTKRFGIVTGLLLAALIGLFVWRVSSRREPLYEGRALTSWLDHHVASSDASPPYGSPGWKKADEALRGIGTNGIPTLLIMIRAKDRPAFIIKCMETARRLGLTGIKWRYARPRQEEAEYAFETLGTNAASAVPELIRIYEQDVSPSSQRCAALALGHIGRGAQAALPPLIRRFNHTNDDVRFYAVSAVMSIGGEVGVVVPALTSALKDSNVNVRWNALVGLSKFGGRARLAVPEILKMMNDPGMVGSSSITQQVATAVWRIAPEQVGKPLVVEDATPMIANGTTTEALKLLFDGKRRILIPLGRTVPAIVQGELIASSGAVTPVARLHSPNTRDGRRLGAWFLGAAVNAPGRYRLRLSIEDASNPKATNAVCLAQTEFMELSPPPNSKQDNR